MPSRPEVWWRQVYLWAADLWIVRDTRGAMVQAAFVGLVQSGMLPVVIVLLLMASFLL